MLLLDSREGYPADVQAAYEFCDAGHTDPMLPINRELQEIANEADYAENYNGQDGDYADFDQFCDMLDSQSC